MAASILVSGASGQLGRRVLEILLERGATSVIAATRTPEKLADLAARGVEIRSADFDAPASLTNVFAGAERALVVSTDAFDRPGRRLGQHLAALRALEAVGVKHVAYTSMPNPHGSPVTIAAYYAGTEDALAASGLDYTILRNNLYAEYLVDSLASALGSGQLVDAKGNGKVAWVTREDCAQAAAGALLDSTPGRRTLDVTGPDALSSDEVAALVSRAIGKPVAHVSVSAEAFRDALTEHGLPLSVAELLASFDRATEAGLLATVSDSVERLSGKKPQRMADLLEKKLRV